MATRPRGIEPETILRPSQSRPSRCLTAASATTYQSGQGPAAREPAPEPASDAAQARCCCSGRWTIRCGSWTSGSRHMMGSLQTMDWEIEP